MRIAFPLATKESAFTVFRALAVPKPEPKPNKWNLEAPYFAVSDKNDDTAFSTEYDLSRCIGSTCYQICLDTIATEAGYESCLASLSSLCFKYSVEALQTCETEQILLPSTEKKLRLWSFAK